MSRNKTALTNCYSVIVKPMGKKKRAFSGRMNDYISSLILVMLVPNSPLIVLSIINKLKVDDVLLAAAMYPISIFVSAKHSSLFSIGIVLSFIFAITFGYINFFENNGSSLDKASIDICFYGGLWTIVAVSFIHSLERADIHLRQGVKFFNFK